MYIGQKVVCIPVTLYDDEKKGPQKPKPQSGRIVYIHPDHRYITVEFAPRIRESFYTDEILQCEKE